MRNNPNIDINISNISLKLGCPTSVGLKKKSFQTENNPNMDINIKYKFETIWIQCWAASAQPVSDYVDILKTKSSV